MIWGFITVWLPMSLHVLPRISDYWIKPGDSRVKGIRGCFGSCRHCALFFTVYFIFLIHFGLGWRIESEFYLDVEMCRGSFYR
jgi:hypothetical protein